MSWSMRGQQRIVSRSACPPSARGLRRKPQRVLLQPREVQRPCSGAISGHFAEDFSGGDEIAHGGEAKIGHGLLDIRECWRGSRKKAEFTSCMQLRSDDGIAARRSARYRARRRSPPSWLSAISRYVAGIGGSCRKLADQPAQCRLAQHCLQVAGNARSRSRARPDRTACSRY